MTKISVVIICLHPLYLLPSYPLYSLRLRIASLSFPPFFLRFKRSELPGLRFKSLVSVCYSCLATYWTHISWYQPCFQRIYPHFRHISRHGHLGGLHSESGGRWRRAVHVERLATLAIGRPASRRAHRRLLHPTQGNGFCLKKAFLLLKDSLTSLRACKSLCDPIKLISAPNSTNFRTSWPISAS